MKTEVIEFSGKLLTLIDEACADGCMSLEEIIGSMMICGHEIMSVKREEEDKEVQEYDGRMPL